MSARKGLWIGVGMLCVFATVVGYLARPEDELAAMMRLHPGDLAAPEGDPGDYYLFNQPASEVSSTIPGIRLRSGTTSSVPYGAITTTDVELPSGGSVEIVGRMTTGPGSKCMVHVFPDKRPWYLKTWSKIKRRLGHSQIPPHPR